MSRKVVYLVAASLDGAIAQADGSSDCFPPEGDHIECSHEMLSDFSDVLMGRRTYEMGLRAGVSQPYPQMHNHIFSRTLPESMNPRVTVVRTPPAGYVARLKTLPGRDIYLCGGGELAAALLAAGLIDEVVVQLNPVLIGEGVRLFSKVAEPVSLKLTGCDAFSSGVVFLTYEVRYRK